MEVETGAMIHKARSIGARSDSFRVASSSDSAKEPNISSRAHVLPAGTVLAELEVNSSTGLSSSENQARTELYGLNKIPERKAITWLERLWVQINSFVIYILIAGAAISFSFNHMIDGYVIIGVVVINVWLGYHMESQAVSATDALKNMMSAQALVLRDGERQEVSSLTLTVGDIFFLQPGDVVPADGRVIKVAGLSVLEAALTGESHAILKDTAPTEHVNAALADRKCVVYSGTQVLQGTATVVVTAIGPDCEIGKISGLLAEIAPEKTPLLVQLDRFGMILSGVIIIMALVTFGIAYARGHSVPEALAIAIGVSVAAIPEGLPSCITVTFSIGVSFMAKRNAVIKSLPAVETLGSVSIICSDKTGTLTINKMTVKSICTASSFVELNDDGSVLAGPPSVAAEAAAPAVSVSLGSLLPGILCNDSVVKMDGDGAEGSPGSPEKAAYAAISADDIELGAVGSNQAPQQTASPGAGAGAGTDARVPAAASTQFTVSGDPTESCIITLAVRMQNSPGAVKALQAEYPRIDEIPFDSATKYMATLHHISAEMCNMITVAATGTPTNAPTGRKVKVVMVKGAPEKVLSLCFVEPAETAYWLQSAESSARKGMRVLGLAFRVVPDDFAFDGHLTAAKDAKLSDRFTMMSLVGIMDPPRPDAIIAVGKAQTAGITVKMITGDHPTTAMAIGRMLGLRTDRGSAITGTDLDNIMITSMTKFDETIVRNDIFARTTPEHKLRIVESLRRQQYVCSMTGDGVNDAPALKAANIGVAMGITGTEVAKDAANMIITDDNFATIVDAIRIGRCVYANLLKIITFVLPSNGGQAFSIIGALIIDVEVPITALQILWVNMITSVTLGIVLAFDKPEDRVLTEPPRRSDKPIFGRLLTWRLVSVTAVLTVVVLGAYRWEVQRGHSVHYLRTVAVNALSAAQIGYIFNCRNARLNLSPAELLGGNKYLYVGIFAVAIAQVLFTYSPGFQYVFETEAIDGVSWGKILLLAVGVFLSVELDKFCAKLIKQCRAPTPTQQVPSDLRRTYSAAQMTAASAV